MPKIDVLPTHKDLMPSVIEALRTLGGSGTIEEIDRKVADIGKFTTEQLEIPHSEKDGRTELEYRLAWARTYLKSVSLLENSSRGVWTLTPAARRLRRIDPDEIARTVHAKRSTPRRAAKGKQIIDGVKPEADWKTELRETLGKLSSASFERLAQRILRESGFVKVEVTGRSGDGGIDGKGVLRVSGLLGFRVIFQCKRYQGAVRVGTVRELQGAMQGRAEKGIIITTGTFTQDAIKEASRDGAPSVDLIDGEQLIEMLKMLNLGVVTRRVELEEVRIDGGWFNDV